MRLDVLPVVECSSDLKQLVLWYTVTAALAVPGFVLKYRRDDHACLALGYSTCLHNALLSVSLCTFVYSSMALAVKWLLAGVAKTRLVRYNSAYNLLLMYAKVSNLCSSVVVYCLRMKVCGSSVFLKRIAGFLLSAGVLSFVQRAMLFEIANRIIWGAYLENIRDTVTVHEILMALYAFANSQIRPNALPPRLAKSTCDLFTIHRSLTFGGIMEDDMDVSHSGGHLFDGVVHRLQQLEMLDKQSSSFSHDANLSSSAVHINMEMQETEVRPKPLQRKQGAQNALPGADTAASTASAENESKLKSLFSKPVQAPAQPSVVPWRHATETLNLTKLRVALHDDLASALLHLLDVDNDGAVTRREFVLGMHRLHEQKVGLRKTLQDYQSMMSILNRAFWSVTGLILFFVLLYAFGVDVIENRVSWISIFIALSVIFGSTLQKFFEGCVLVFVWRPYNVGDRVFLKDESGREINLVVQRIQLLSTQFLRADGQIIILSHTALQNRSISNGKRSALACLQFHVKVSASTALETVAALQEELQAYSRLSAAGHVTSARVIFADTRTDEAGLLTTLTVQLHLNKGWQHHNVRNAVLDEYVKCVHGFLCTAGQQDSTLTLS